MSLNAKDAIIEVLSDGKPRTAPELVAALLEKDDVWFRNICRSAVSSKCADLVRDGRLIRADVEYRPDRAQPYIVWRIASCPEERRSRRDRSRRRPRRRPCRRR